MAQQVYDRPGADYDHEHDPDVGYDGGAVGKKSDPRGDYDPQKTPMGDSSDPRGSLKNAENNPNARGGTHGGGSEIPSPSELGDAEDDADDIDDENGLWRPNKASQKLGKLKFFKKHKKATAAFGALGSVSILTIVLFSSISQGPLEFIHLAQLLERFHFASQEDAQDGRLMKIARYIHDPSKPQNTRLGIVGNIAADHLESKINEATGLKSAYDPVTGSSTGYTVDLESSQFKDKNTSEIKQVLVDQYGVDPDSVTISASSDGKQTIGFDPDPGGWNSIKRYRAQTSFSRLVLGEAGYSKISTHVGSRVLGKRAGWTFHPIKKLDSSIINATIKGGKKAYDKLRDKINAQEATYEAGGDTTRPGGEAKAQEEKDAKGNPVADPQGQAESDGANDLENAASSLDPEDPDTTKSFSNHVSAKIAGGGVGLIGVACVIRSLSATIGNEKQAKVVLPAMRKAGKVFSIGSQAQSGQDIDTLQLGIYKNDWLDTTNDKGQITSTWDQARSIQAENGQPQTGPDLPQQDQVFNSGNPFDFLDNVPELGTACKVLGSSFVTAFSIVTGPVSYVVSGEIMKAIIPALAGWLSGSPLNPIASGAEFGNIVNYGARLSANDQYASAGGVPLSGTDEIALKNVNSALDQKDFQSKSIAYRLFNPDDSRTLTSHLIDQQDLNVPQNVANITNDFASIFKAAIKIPATLLSGTTHADDQTYSYHGLKAVGFTASELGDPRFDDPFKNACYVVGCHDSHNNITGIFEDSSKAQKYTDLAQKCFGVNIADTNGVWGIDSNTQAVNFDSTSYPSSDCESSSLDWLRIRFWLLDTPTMEGYACSQDLDSQSCQDLGLNGTPSDGSTAPTTAAGATIDMNHLYDDSTSVACAPGTNDAGTADGYHDNNKVKIRLCEIPNFPCTCSGTASQDGHVVMNSRVSGAVLAMVTAAKQAGVNMSADNTFRTMSQQQALWVEFGEDTTRVARPGTSNHQMGLAIDFNGVGSSAAPGSGPIWDWLDKNAANFGYKNYPAEAWHWSPTGN